MTALGRLPEVWAKVDAFFARAAAAHGGPTGITCHDGCDGCCQRRLTVTRLEADAIASEVARLGDEATKALAARQERDDPDGPCAALVAGRCAIYEARPLVCRTHGLAIRFREAHAGRSLPVLDACPLNFAGVDLAALPPSSILDQATLSALLGALDAAHADERGAPRGERVELAALLRSLL